MSLLPTEAARTLFAKRYRRNRWHDGREDGPPETEEQMFRRVANAIADADHNPDEVREPFYELMSSLRFLPNSPTLMNAGANGTLSACFTFVPDDNLESILDIGTLAGKVLKYGGGVGYGLSRLRAAGSLVAGTGGRARGPLAAIPYYQSIAAFVEQAGKRDGAQMAILHCDHPDLWSFIGLKNSDPQRYNTFNISIAATDRWMAEFVGVGRDSGNPLWDVACKAWTTGDPGLYFIDRAEQDNPTPWLGKLESTNPCGEVPLLPFEACTLGSINLERYVRPGWSLAETNRLIDWDALKRDVELAVRFLDDVISANSFPDERIANVVQSTRKIGLGVMGWADLLASCHILYDSDRAIEVAHQVGALMRKWADEASRSLGEARGICPAEVGQVRIGQLQEKLCFRNATRLCIAPTGSISILAGCSSGIEPHFALEYERTMGDGTKLSMTENGDVGGFTPRLAHDVHWSWHVEHQAAWQMHVDLAVSKTINLPNNASVKDVYDAYVAAWQSGCKGVTVFRDGCREGGEQVLFAPKAGAQMQAEIDDIEQSSTTGYPSPLHEIIANATPGTGKVEQLLTPSIEEESITIKGKYDAGIFTEFILRPERVELRMQSRRRLPPTRPSTTYKFRVGDEEGYLIVGRYEDGRPGELFIVLNRQGASVRAWADLTATFVSMLLQYGAPIEEIIAKLRATRFEPSGLTGDKDIPIATSIADFVGHLLEREFLGTTPPVVKTGERCPDCSGGLVHQSGCEFCPSCGWERCG